MKFDIVKLRFTTPVRFGEEGIVLERFRIFLHSDTLFSALASAWVEVYGFDEGTRIIESFDKTSSLLISSAFPWFGERQLFPKPATHASLTGEKLGEKYEKKLKKVRFLTKEVFESWINETPLDDGLIESALEIKFLESFTRPLVSLDRITSNSNIYYMSAAKFFVEGGVYFLFKILDGGFRDKLEAAISYLGDTGIGGKKTWGLGRFEYEFKEIDLNTPKSPNAFLTLSLSIPGDDEIPNINTEKSFYALIRRRGWIASRFFLKNVRKKSVIAFTEGSVFPVEFKGRLTDVTPKHIEGEIPHRTYRYTYPFWLPIRRMGDGKD